MEEEKEENKMESPPAMEEDPTAKKEEAIIVGFGTTGVGKSTLLSFLAGKDPEENDDAPFKAATSSTQSCTQQINFHTGQMYGTKRMVKLIDMPGMNDTHGVHHDVQALKNLHLTMSGVCQTQYSCCLLVINVTGKLTESMMKMIEVARCFFIDSRIICCFTFQPRKPQTKEGCMRQYEEVFMSKSWHFRGYVSIGLEKSETYGQEIEKLIPEGYNKIPEFEELTDDQKKVVTANLEYIFASEGGGCFPAGATIQANDVLVAMENLQINQNISSWTTNMDLSHDDKIVTFIHRDEKTFYPYAKITTENDSSIEISSRHLIYANQNGSLQFVWPKDLKVGDSLIKNDKSLQKITKIEQVVKQGRYAPLSNNGTLVVNGFLVSCYAEHESHFTAHMAFQPLILKNKMLKERSADKIDGIHPYAQMLIKSFPQQRQIHQSDDLKHL